MRPTIVETACILAKKRRGSSPENLIRRKAFAALLRTVDPGRLVFLDESFCQTGMRRGHAWAAKGSRVFDVRPGRTWWTTSLAGAIRLGQKPRLMTQRGAINGRDSAVHSPVPCAVAHRGDVVVMDNLVTHKMKSVRAAIEAAGAAPVYLTEMDLLRLRKALLCLDPSASTIASPAR
jgi:hypothetical protein